MPENPARWEKAVHYLWKCDICGFERNVAVIKRRAGRRARLCRECYLDGQWRST